MAEKLPIKFKIIKKWPEVRGIDVHFYTDEMVAAVQPKWEKERAEIKASWPEKSIADVEDIVVRKHPAGAILHVTIYPNPAPTGRELVNYIMTYAPYNWLVHVQKCIHELPSEMPELDTIPEEVTAVPTHVEALDVDEELKELLKTI